MGVLLSRMVYALYLFLLYLFLVFVSLSSSCSMLRSWVSGVMLRMCLELLSL